MHAITVLLPSLLLTAMTLGYFGADRPQATANNHESADPPAHHVSKQAHVNEHLIRDSESAPSKKEYLKEIIPPCTLVVIPKKDPCEARRFVGLEVDTHTMVIDYDYERTHAVLLDEAVGFRDQGSESSYRSTTHIAFRGTGLPGTTRCQEWGWSRHHFFADPEKQKKRMEATYADHGLIGCFTDFTIQEYLAGEGPTKLTVMVYKRFVTAGGFETFSAHEHAALSQIKRAYAGSEWVMYIRPSDLYHLEGFEMIDAWDVQFDPSRPFASDKYVSDIALLTMDQRRYIEDEFGNPIITEKHRARARREYPNWICEADLCAVQSVGVEIMELQEFQNDTRARYQRLLTMYNGRIRPEPYYASILQDANKLHSYYSNVIRAYDHPSITPAEPLPALGMLSPDSPEIERASSRSRRSTDPDAPDSVALSWKTLPGAQAYRIETRESDADDWKTFQEDVSDPSHEVRGLKCGTGYRFRVSAYGFIYGSLKVIGARGQILLDTKISTLGWGPPSEEISATTAPCVRTP